MNSPDELTIEELMGIATKDGKAIPTLVEDKSNVRLYLREQGVKDGSIRVPNYVIYHDYCKNWHPKGNKLSKIGFLRKISVIFESTRTGKTRYYLLNQGVFNLSEENINEAKEFNKRKARKIKKRKQEIKKQVSCTREKVHPEN